MAVLNVIVYTLVLTAVCVADTNTLSKKHHKHHKHSHNHTHGHGNATDKIEASNQTVATKAVAPPVAAAQKVVKTNTTMGAAATIMDKMKSMEKELEAKETAGKTVYNAPTHRGKIEVNGPLPADFDERFAQAVAQATGCDPADVKVVETAPLEDGVVEVVFESSSDVVKSVEDQAADPDSKLANGPMHSFLVADGSVADREGRKGESVSREETPVSESGIDVDTEMPYGELEPFGREDTAQELTEQSVKESDEMVDQLERAEVAEEKRSVFRALTRLRGAAITSFDGVARAQTGNIDEYNKVHKWRKTHPLHHLADEESDITKWAFPDNADF